MVENVSQLLGTQLEEAQDTRRLYGASDNEPAIIVEIPSHRFRVKQSRIVISQQDVGSTFLIWGDPTLGVWGSQNWSDVGGSEVTNQVINYNDTFEEWFYDDRFNDGTITTADWTNVGSVVFMNGSDTMQTELIFADRDRRVATEVYLSSHETGGSFLYEVSTDSGNTWEQITNNDYTTVGSGDSMILRVGSAVATGSSEIIVPGDGGSITDFHYLINGSSFDEIGLGSQAGKQTHMWYQLDDTAGSMDDSSVNTFTGSISGGVIRGTDGLIGSCYIFDGVDGFVNIPGSNIYNEDIFSIVYWQKNPPAPATQFLYSESNTSTSNSFFGLRLSGSFVTGGLRHDDGTNLITFTSSVPVSNDIWHHVAYINNGSDFNLYIDGELDQTGSYRRSIITTDTTDIGRLTRTGAGNYYVGSIDDFRTYTSELTQRDIKEIYNDGAGILTEVGSRVNYYDMIPRTNVPADILDYGSGHIGSAVHISGSAWLESGSDLFAGSESISIATWINTSYDGLEVIMDKYIGTNDINRMFIQIGNPGSGLIKFFGRDDNVTGSVLAPIGSEINDGGWHHIVCVRDLTAGSIANLYIDGNFTGSSDGFPVGNINNNGAGSGHSIGATKSSNQFYTGSLDDFRVYKQALCSHTISLIYNNGAGTESDLVGSVAGSSYFTQDPVELNGVLNVKYTLTDI